MLENEMFIGFFSTVEGERRYITDIYDIKTGDIVEKEFYRISCSKVRDYFKTNSIVTETGFHKLYIDDLLNQRNFIIDDSYLGTFEEGKILQTFKYRLYGARIYEGDVYIIYFIDSTKFIDDLETAVIFKFDCQNNKMIFQNILKIDESFNIQVCEISPS